jgi:ABC-2 type transport system permease protein
VQVRRRLRAAEAEGPRVAGVATAVSRYRWVASHAVATLAGATALLLLYAVGLGLVAGVVVGDPAGQVRAVLSAGLAQLPGVVVVGAVVIAVVGVLPRVAGVVCWGLLVAAVLAGPLFGETLRLPQWAQDLSPFTHVPKAPAVPVTAAPVLALLAVGAVLAVAGLLSLRRRNLALPA